MLDEVDKDAEVRGYDDCCWHWDFPFLIVYPQYIMVIRLCQSENQEHSDIYGDEDRN